MIIGFDAKRFFHNFSGLGNYSRTLIGNLSLQFPNHTYRLYTPSIRPHPVINKICARKNIEVVTPRRKTILWRSRGMIQQFSPDMDIFHGLSHELPFGIKHANVKSVVTIHDLIYHFYPGDFPWIDRKIYNIKFRHACRQADLVVAISDSTKKDICEVFRIPEGKVKVVYQSVNSIYETIPSESVLEKIIDKYKLPSAYNLYVGSLLPRKNFKNTLIAYLQYLDEANTPLVVLGIDPLKLGKLQSLIQQSPHTNNIIFLGQIDPNDLPVLYNQATITLYPSKYEGFGLPIVESLKMGTPVITSKVSSMPEAAGAGAIFVNPNDPTDICKNIQALMHNGPLQNKLVLEGKEHIMKFDAEYFTDQMMKLYEKVLG